MPVLNEAEVSLREQSRIMQRSILEGAAAGGASGMVFDLLKSFDGDDNGKICSL